MFMSQHYTCCKGGCGDATELKQDLILAAIAALVLGGGSASETKQDDILAELAKLTRPTMS